jgi:hypothetical protein
MIPSLAVELSYIAAIPVVANCHDGSTAKISEFLPDSRKRGFFRQRRKFFYFLDFARVCEGLARV